MDPLRGPSYIGLEQLHYCLTNPWFVDYEAFKKRYSSVLQALVSVDMDFNQLSAYLASQKNKRQVYDSHSTT